jgi:RNA polymerase sigma-70 factor (ECF subfamily)
MRIEDAAVRRLADWHETHVSELRRFAASLVGWQDADDLVSQAIAAVLARPPATVHSLDGYFYTVVLNTARRHWRRSRRERDYVRRFMVPAQFCETNTVDESVAIAVAGLSVQQRAAIYLTYWADMDPASIAQRLGVSEGSVRKHLARGRRRLKEIIDEPQ